MRFVVAIVLMCALAAPAGAAGVAWRGWNAGLTAAANSRKPVLVDVPGFLPADQFMKLARYIGDGHLDRGVSWESYSARSGGAK